MLGNMVDKATLRPVDTLKQRDVSAAKDSDAGDALINRKRFDVEATMLPMATQQPMASDLRRLAAIRHIKLLGDYRTCPNTSNGTVPIGRMYTHLEYVVVGPDQIRTEGALPLPCDMILDRDVAATLRDGTVLYTDVFRPVAQGAYPAVVAWSPYGKELGGQVVDDLPNRSGVAKSTVSMLNKFEGPDPAFWVAKGYVVVNPDTRGAYKSGGNLVFWGRQLAEDGYDFIEWAAAQDWSNGRIGLAGNSWLAISHWFIVAERPPHLAAIAPWEGLCDLMREVSLRGGIPMVDLPEIIIQTPVATGSSHDTRPLGSSRKLTPHFVMPSRRRRRFGRPRTTALCSDRSV